MNVGESMTSGQMATINVAVSKLDEKINCFFENSRLGEYSVEHNNRGQYNTHQIQYYYIPSNP